MFFNKIIKINSDGIVAKKIVRDFKFLILKAKIFLIKLIYFNVFTMKKIANVITKEIN